MIFQRLKETPSQTAGPYVHLGTVPSAAGLEIRTQENPHILQGDADGTRIRIEGLLIDGAGQPVTDAMMEIWQADSKGRYGQDGFFGWGRTVTDWTTGRWWFETVKPGPVPYRDGRTEAPHIDILIFSRGINIHLHTRLYFADEAEANADDPVLKAAGAPWLQETMIAGRFDADGMPGYRLDIHLQGEKETVFLDM
ncbi:protocatechuate 3,4-dioxygenase subunit alpha [Lutibaculum baratangense]|uniref:Protocatechuate 3,4-dioxygenase alpha chain n=1 Tax=Lutibaculum baratangense AMV1 TaxID=631454 RepID=V4RAL5_9HYPH|nr:protocatechuate 3,4-dioxygenase subunit alpha [Lutibaculum baratangense]ESR23221.1 Protocatechuate 3,4-dioxygenase alpha chain [Lutibaculum baratangense AMV1]